MNISKSTPYVRYKENFSSTLHLGSIHVESEYLDRTQKTTLESIQGMTWHNKVVNENKELNLLSEHSLLLEGETHKEFFDTTPHRLSVDEIHGLQDVEPNEDGTFTYRVTSLEGEYAQIYDGVNNIMASSDTLEPQFEITYDTNEEDLMGSVVLDDTAPTHTIEMSNVGTLDGIMIGKTLVNNILDSSEEEYVCLGDYNSQSITIDNSVEGNFGSAILKGQTLINSFPIKDTTITLSSTGQQKLLNQTKLSKSIPVGKQAIFFYDNNFPISAQRGFIQVYRAGDKGDSVWMGSERYSSKENGHNHIIITNTFEFDITHIDFYINNAEAGDYSFDNMMLLDYQEGMENWDIPYFEGMQSVKMPILTTTGKNLFDKNKATKDAIISVNGQLSPLGGSGCTDYIRVENGKTYINTKSSTIAQYDINKTFISRTTATKKFVATYDGYIRWNLGSFDTMDTIQIEESSIFTSYEPYKSNILTVNEDVTLRSNGDVYDELNLLTGRLTQRIDENNEVLVQAVVKTVDLSILDQDNNPTTFHTYNETTHINTSSEGLTPFIEIDNPKYEVMLKPNTTYTIKMNRTNVPENSDFQVNLAGVVTSIDNDVESFTVKTYSTLSNNEMKFIGHGNKFKNVMLLEGNHVNSQIEHFEGMQSVENPSLETVGKNLFDTKAIPRMGSEYNDFTKPYATTIKPILNLKPNTVYQINGEITQMPNRNSVFKFVDNNGVEIQGTYVSMNNTNGSESKKFKVNNKFTTGNNGEIYLNTFPAYTQEDLDKSKDILNSSKIQIEEGSTATSYESYKSNILTVNEQIELRGIGDVRDEFNVETGEYIQRIGEITFDGGEDWQRSTVNGKNTFTIPHGGKAKGGVISLSSEVVCDKNNATPYETFFYIGGSYFNYLTTKDFTRTEFKQYLQSNPITIQYVLAEPITYKIDISILDQDGEQLRTFHTFEDTTHISTSSDTLIPNTNINYEITTSVATVTGSSASFDNGENGSPISAVVYGESLLNCVQDKGNSEIVCLGDHSGTNITIENTVEGNIKNAILKGQTLVNLFEKTSVDVSNPPYLTIKGNVTQLKAETTYTIKYFNLPTEKIKQLRVVERHDGYSDMLHVIPKVGNGTFTTKTDFSTFKGLFIQVIETESGGISAEELSKVKIVLIEGDYTNQDIPYFEGMKSVTNPSVTVCGKNLFNSNRYTWSQGGINDAGNPSSATTPSFITALTPIEEFPIKQGETAYLTCTLSTNKWTQVFFYDSTKTPIGRALNHAQEAYLPISLTVPTNASYFRIHLGTENVETGTMTYKKADCVANIGYTGNTVSVNEEVHLHRIGNIYDELNVTTGELTQRVPEIVLDGNNDNITYKTYGTNNEGYSVFQCTISESIYGKRKFNGKWMSTFPQGSQQASDWKDKEYVGGNWYGATSLPNTFVIKLLTSSLSSDDINGFKEYLQHNPITIQYELAEPITESVDLSIVDQDNNSTTFHSYDTITHINTSSDYLKPTLEITNPTYNVILKPNTEYTIKTNRTNRATLTSDVALDVNLGGSTISMDSVTNHVKVTTPSTLENNTLILSGFGNKVKDIMVIEGDYVDRDLDFFEGFISVENPMVQIYNDNMWGKLILPPATIESFETNYSSYITTKKPVLTLKPNTRYIINADITTKEQIVATLLEITEQGTHRGLAGFNITGTGRIASYFDTTNGEVYLNFYPGYNDEDIKMVFDLLEQTNFTVCEYSKYGNNINTVIEKKSNTLTTYPQVTLRSIGDIKDEWDVVGETVTRRIGEIVLDGNSGYHSALFSVGNNTVYMQWFDNVNQKIPSMKINSKLLCDRLPNLEVHLTDIEGIDCHTINGNLHFNISKDKLTGYNLTFEGMKQYLNDNPLLILYELETPITESVRITPPNPQTSTASITIPTQLNHVEDTSDFLVWNPYKEHYVRYNYVEDGVVLDNYTWENLTDLNERQFVEFYNKRTYVYQPYHNYVASHDSKGTSKYVLLEPNHDYTVSVRFSELPECETVKVNLGGAEVEMDVNNPHVHITTPTTLLNNLCSISGEGLTGKITDILVIHCLYHEGFADIDYFEGIDGIGEIVDDGVNITLEQTNGNLIDVPLEIYQNGNGLRFSKSMSVRPNKEYVFRTHKNMSIEEIDKDGNKVKNLVYGNNDVLYTQTNTNKINISASNTYSNDNGSTHIYHPIELCYKGMEKDYIRPRYYDAKELILPMQLCRIHDTYDNLYYDEAKGFYRIQQTVGHKYFTGSESENWTLIENTGRVLRFRYNNADIQIKSLGEYMTNLLPNGTTSSPYESCTFNGTTFIVSLDIERFEIISLEQFKLWLSEHPLHLYYQLMTPIMVDLPQYNKRIEFNTYKDEIYTFFKNCKPTVFTLGVPLDKTYRFYEYEESQGYANRVELTDERMTDEDTLYIDTIYGSGFSNLIENPNNVETLLKPNYQGKAVSHTLTNGKVSSIKVHGFEPNETTIANYNSTLKQYELIVQAQKEQNINTQTLAVPYKLEVYEDGTKDKVYYDEQNKVFRFEGGSVTNPPYNNSYIFNTPLEVFKGIAPRTGLIAEIKVKFNSGTTSARIYYSLDGGATTAYSTLRSMTDEVEYYIGFFNTGGTKLDYATKLSAEAEYINLAPLSSTLPESLIITQIQNISECTFTLDKTYYFDSWIKPLELDVYNGETIITEQSGAIVTINNNGLHKDALTYTDETYTVYWTYVGGEGNVTITLGGAKVEVVGTQGYATLKTAIDGVQDGLIIGGYNLSIKDLMLIKGERIEDLAYFEGSKAVGTAFVDENGETKYKITLVTGSELINDKFENRITFEDNNKHNVVVTKLLGNKPNKK